MLSDGDANIRMTINNSGNVGIGTTSPSYNLVSAVARGSVSFALYNKTAATYDGFISSASDNGLIINARGQTAGNASGDTLYLQTGDSNRITISSSGNVGIGTISPDAPLHLYGGTKTSYKLVGGSTDSDMFQKFVVQIDNVYTWTTLLTITPSTVGATWMRGWVRFGSAVHNSGNGNGASSDNLWYLDMNGGSGMTTAQMSAGQTSGSFPEQFRVIVSSNTWQLQVQSSNTANRSDGVAMFEILLSHGAGTTATYTIA